MRGGPQEAAGVDPGPGAWGGGPALPRRRAWCGTLCSPQAVDDDRGALISLSVCKPNCKPPLCLSVWRVGRGPQRGGDGYLRRTDKDNDELTKDDSLSLSATTPSFPSHTPRSLRDHSLCVCLWRVGTQAREGAGGGLGGANAWGKARSPGVYWRVNRRFSPAPARIDSTAAGPSPQKPSASASLMLRVLWPG